MTNDEEEEQRFTGLNVRPSLPQELFRISKEHCDFKVTAGPSTADDNKGSSGGDSTGSSPSPSSNTSAPPKKTGKFISDVESSLRTSVLAPDQKKRKNLNVNLMLTFHS